MQKIIAVLVMMMVLCGFSVNADTNTQGNALEGKRIVVIGDSYVENHSRPWSESWHARAAKRLGMYYLNFGRNGSCIAFDRTKEGFGEAMTKRYLKMPSEADYVLVIAGHNDAFTVGKDPSQMDVFKASLEKFLTGLQQRYPDAAIGYVLPWHLKRAGFEEVISEIRSACSRHSIPVFDAGADCGIEVNDDEFRAKYFQNKGVGDTAHLNAAGHALVVDKGVAFIKSLSRK